MLGSRIEGSEWIMAATIVIVIAIIICHLILFWTGSQGLLQAQFLFQRFLLPPVHLICILLGNLARQIFSPSPSLGTSIPYLSLNCPFSSICSANVHCCSSIVADHALITKLIIHCSGDCACTDYVAENAMIRWLIIACSAT